MEHIITLFFIMMGTCWIASTLLRGIVGYLSRINGVLRVIFTIVGYLSSGFHEFCHLLGFYLCWVPLKPSEFRMSLTYLIFAMNSRVKARISFVKVLIIILSPLLAITGIALALYLYAPLISLTLQYLLWGIVTLVGLYCSPSMQDWKIVVSVIRLKPWAFMRQMGEILVSIVIGYISVLEWWSGSIFLGAELLWNSGIFVLTILRKIRNNHVKSCYPQSIPIQVIFPSHKQISPKPLRKEQFRRQPKMFRDIARSRQQMDNVVARYFAHSGEDTPNNS